MESAELEAKIYQTLKTENLLSKLGNGEDSIFHNQAPPMEEMIYPAIVYTLMSYKPFFWADDLIWAREAKFRIHVLTQNAEYADIEKEIETIMTEKLKAIRYDRTPYNENKEKNVILDYRMRINEEPSEEVPQQPSDSETGECDCHYSSETSKISLITNEEIDTFFEDLEKEGK